MLRQLLIAAVLLAICVLIHGFGTHALLGPLRRRYGSGKLSAAAHPFGLLVFLFLFIFALHAIEMLVWAVAFWLADALPSFGEAVYFSISSYTTVGYGDVVLGPEWRTLGASEAAVGVLLFGWSTALLFAVIQRLYHQPD
ncbi:MAG: potassium channel family protein [Burkholderiales bacterium]